MPLGGAIVARTTARATGELALTKRTGLSSWANVAERGRGQAGRSGDGDAPGEPGPQGPPATTHTGTAPTPQPRRPPPGTWGHDGLQLCSRHVTAGHPRAHGAMIEGTPTPLHPPSMAVTELAHALLPGLPAPHPGENRLHPLPTDLYRRDTAVSRALRQPPPSRMGEDLSQSADPTAGANTAQFQRTTPLAATQHGHEGVTSCSKLTQVVRAHDAQRSGSVAPRGIPWGAWGK